MSLAKSIKERFPTLKEISDEYVEATTISLINRNLKKYFPKDDSLEEQDKQELKQELFLDKIANKTEEIVGSYFINYGSDKAINDLSNKIELMFNKPKKKGIAGENNILSELQNQFNNVKDMSGISHCGDIWIENRVMLDIKNYKNTLPKSQIEKFKQDMDQNKDIICGMLLSLNSGISGHNIFSLEEYGENRFIFYLPNSGSFPLTPLIEIGLKLAEYIVNKANKEKKKKDLSKFANLYLENLNEQMENYNEMNELCTKLSSKIGTFYSHLNSLSNLYDSYLS